MMTVVIPTLNAAATLRACVSSLALDEGLVSEVIVSDGGSSDTTAEIARAIGARLVSGTRGRGEQLAAGCAAATRSWLLALHADTRLGAGWSDAVRRHVADHPQHAGWFDFRLDDPRPIARLWEAGVALRSRWAALPYGDQGLIISRALYDAVEGYRPLPLMEDVDLVRRLGRHRLRPLGAWAVTSAERYRREGYWRRSARNGWLLGRYLAGADPHALARRYD